MMAAGPSYALGGPAVEVAFEDINDLVGEIYDAAMFPERWPAALDRLAQLLGGAAFVMSALHRSEGMKLGVTTAQDPAAAEILRTRFSLARNNPLVAAMPGLPAGELVARKAVYPDHAYLRGELYNEVFRGQDLVHHVVACLHRDEDLVCPMGILRPRPAGEFSGGDMRLLGMLLPHLSRAVKLTLRLSDLHNALSAGAQALDRLPLAIFVVVGHRKTMHLNAAAEKISSAADGLWLRNGELAAWRHAESTALVEAISLALSQPGRATLALRVHRRSGKSPYAVVVVPLGGQLSSRLAQAPQGAMVLVNDPASAIPGRGRLLRELFDLTAREAQLAEALLSGKRLEEYAAKQNVSINTAKTQLRSLFAKTQTRRQAELVRVLNEIPAVEGP